MMIYSHGIASSAKFSAIAIKFNLRGSDSKHVIAEVSG